MSRSRKFQTCQPAKGRAHGAPPIVKRYVRWLFGKDQAVSQKTSQKASQRASQKVSHRTAQKAHNHRNQAPQKAFIATGSAATLALLALVPGKVASQAVSSVSCQEVIQSGAEISRGELANLASIPKGATSEAVRELIDVPYCLLPVLPSANDTSAKDTSTKDTSAKLDSSVEAVIRTREAYPLAFDPEAWVVVTYAESGYAGYDFVFKP